MTGRLEHAINQLISDILLSFPDDNEINDKERIALLLTQTVGISVHSMGILVEKSFMSARDALSISRSVCDASVNLAYLLHGDEKTAEKARRHALQKVHRQHSREGQVGGLKFKVSGPLGVNVSDLEGLEEALNEFTRSSGAEIREWSGKTIDQKIESIAKDWPKCGMSLAASRINIYGVSSEILHGSPFSAIYFWTGLTGKPSKAKARHNMMAHYLTAVCSAAFAIDGVVEAWGKIAELPNLVWDSKAIYASFGKSIQLEVEGDVSSVFSADVEVIQKTN